MKSLLAWVSSLVEFVGFGLWFPFPSKRINVQVYDQVSRWHCGTED